MIPDWLANCTAYRTFQNNQRLRVFVLFQLSTGSLRTLVRPLADNVTTVQNNPEQSEVACICTLSAFYHMAKQHRREVAHATDEGKASIKKNMTNLGFGLKLGGKGQSGF